MKGGIWIKSVDYWHASTGWRHHEDCRCPILQYAPDQNISTHCVYSILVIRAGHVYPCRATQYIVSQLPNKPFQSNLIGGGVNRKTIGFHAEVDPCFLNKSSALCYLYGMALRTEALILAWIWEFRDAKTGSFTCPLKRILVIYFSGIRVSKMRIRREKEFIQVSNWSHNINRSWPIKGTSSFNFTVLDLYCTVLLPSCQQPTYVTSSDLKFKIKRPLLHFRW